jgi:hypothetical protein
MVYFILGTSDFAAILHLQIVVKIGQFPQI